MRMPKMPRTKLGENLDAGGQLAGVVVSEICDWKNCGDAAEPGVLGLCRSHAEWLGELQRVHDEMVSGFLSQDRQRSIARARLSEPAIAQLADDVREGAFKAGDIACTSVLMSDGQLALTLHEVERLLATGDYWKIGKGLCELLRRKVESAAE